VPEWSDLAAVFSPKSPVKRAEQEGARTSVEHPPPDPPPDPDELDEGASALDGGGAAPSPIGQASGPGDRFGELGEHVARILGAAQEAGEAMRREARAVLDVRVAEVEAELERRRLDLDQREQAFEHRRLVAEDEAAARAVNAIEDAERQAAGVRAVAAERLEALLAVHDSLREQLDAAFGELRLGLAVHR
jgi:hypothetical protein